MFLCDGYLGYNQAKKLIRITYSKQFFTILHETFAYLELLCNIWQTSVKHLGGIMHKAQKHFLKQLYISLKLSWSMIIE